MRKHIVSSFIALGVIAAAGCGGSRTPPIPATPPPPSEHVDEGGREIFRNEGLDGAFVLMDLKDRTVTVVDAARASQGYLPCSTFKIPNTLIGLDTGVISDEHFTLKWDGTVRSRGEWNRDHDLASAMKYSVVWYYQEVARRIGPDRMRAHLDAFDYGNKDMSGKIDAFWLADDAKLRISPRQQVELLARLRARTLPVKPEHAAIVEKIIVLEEGPGWTLRGKTGTGIQGKEHSLGWLVGLVDRGDRAWAFATITLGKPEESALPELMKKRMPITKALLRRERVLD